jgi:hypothetical protein
MEIYNMGEKLKERLNSNSCSIWVVLYGVFVGFSLISQCIIQLLFKYFDIFTDILNENFSVPIEQIVWIYTIICPLFIGVDRVSFFSLVAKTTDTKESDINIGHPERLRFIIIQSFLLYSLACIIHLFFDVDVQLMPLSISLGSSVLIYIVGQKSMTIAKSIANTKDIDGDGIDDDLQDPNEVLKRLREKLADGKTITFSDLDDDGIDDNLQSSSEVLSRVKEKHKLGQHITISTNK